MAKFTEKYADRQDKTWKKVLGVKLRELGFIDSFYTGRIIIDIRNGGVGSLEQQIKRK